MNKKPTVSEEDRINTKQYNKRIEHCKMTIDKMIADIREHLDLKEQQVEEYTFRSGILELEDGTIISYTDFLQPNGDVQETNLNIIANNNKSQWEINGSCEQYQIFNTEYSDKKIQTSWGAEINETVSSKSQQYNGTTVISIDEKSHMCVKENDISGFGTIDSTIFSPELKMYSLFLNHGDTVEYKGEYDFDLIRRATYDIQGISQMQEDNCIYNEQRLNEYNDIRKKLANLLVTKKPEKEVEHLLQVRSRILEMCNPLLDEAEQVVASTLKKIKTEKDIDTDDKKVFGKLLDSKSLQEIKQESQNLAQQEHELANQYSQIQEEEIGDDNKDER